jgi:hypothetical protein
MALGLLEALALVEVLLGSKLTSTDFSLRGKKKHG